jgi:hypothetical protein
MTVIELYNVNPEKNKSTFLIETPTVAWSIVLMLKLRNTSAEQIIIVAFANSGYCRETIPLIDNEHFKYENPLKIPIIDIVEAVSIESALGEIELATGSSSAITKNSDVENELIY